MLVPIMIDVSAEQGDLYPKGAPPGLFRGASRVGENLSLTSTEDPSGAMSACRQAGVRFAVGPAEIWEVFPEYRGEFIVSVLRRQPAGWFPLQIPLRLTISGDRLGGDELYLTSNPYVHENQSLITVGVMKRPPSLGEPFPSFRNDPGSGDVDLRNRWVVFVDRISFPDGFEFGKACSFLSPPTLLERSNLLGLLAERAGSSRGSGQFRAPDRFTGALVFPATLSDRDADFVMATVARILAASATVGTSGITISALQITDGGASQNWLGHQNWGRPYADRRLRHSSFLGASGLRRVDWCFKLISNSSPTSYRTAKDDFRLLALDTVEDSRHSNVPELQFAQMWMAVERLLPFRKETTANLTLALVALFDAEQRIDMLKSLKQSYAERSNIVHGYNFKRDETNHQRVGFIADLFRRMFDVAASFSKADILSSAMIGHVVSGVREPFGASVGAGR